MFSYLSSLCRTAVFNIIIMYWSFFWQVQIYFSEVLDWQANLSSEEKWDEKDYSPTRKKLLSALESISGSKSEVLLKQLPQNALYEERAILLGKMNQHELALSIYVHKVLFMVRFLNLSTCCPFFLLR